MHIPTLPQESEIEVETAQTQSESESQPETTESSCPFCGQGINWVNGVPIEADGTVHLTQCNMGRF